MHFLFISVIKSYFNYNKRTKMKYKKEEQKHNPKFEEKQQNIIQYMTQLY